MKRRLKEDLILCTYTGLHNYIDKQLGDATRRLELAFLMHKVEELKRKKKAT